MMKLRVIVEKTPDANLMRKMISFAAERLMEIAVGAAWVEKSPPQRNGYRDRKPPAPSDGQSPTRSVRRCPISTTPGRTYSPT